jgi:hypothetical protein
MIPRAWENGWKKDFLKKLQIVIISQESGGINPSDKITITCHRQTHIGFPGTQSLDSRGRFEKLLGLYISMIDLIWAEQRD